MISPTEEEVLHNHAWTVTFYAYKGGTGRTLALSNVARLLAEKRGFRVGVIDLDVDSPGLPHQPLCATLDNPSPANGAAVAPDAVERPPAQKRDDLRDTINNTAGFIDLFLDRFARDGEAQALDANTLRPASLAGYVVPLPDFCDGALILMSAGRDSLAKTASYRTQVAAFNAAFAALGADRATASAATILDDFARQYWLDFLLIDARTGTGPTFPTYAYVVPHALFLFMGLNEQNMEGSLSVLQESTTQPVAAAHVSIVASPVPTVGPSELEARLRSVTGHLDQLRRERLERTELSSEPIHYIYPIPEKIDFQLPYSDMAAYEETYFIDRFPHSGLARQYRKISDAIRRLVLAPPTLAASRVSGHITEGCGDVVTIAAEDVNLEYFKKLLENSHSGRITTKHTWRFQRQLNNDLLPEVSLSLYDATDPNAPWERWRNQDILAEPDCPDILMVPQSDLGTIGTEPQLPVWTIEELRKEYQGAEFLSSDFLDRGYPGWRKSCSFGAATLGLPFSLSTTILCINKELLRALSQHRAEEIYSAKLAKHDLLFPTSWQLLKSLVETDVDPKSRAAPFGMATSSRALYYEWLNVLLAFGGVDFQPSEGNTSILPDLASPRALAGTYLFVKLAAAVAATVLNSGASMTEVSAAFQANELAMYVAWTDNFLVEPNKNWELRLGKLPGRTTTGKNAGVKADNLLLGRIPRDVRYPRSPLVAGWLMVFPRHGKKPSNAAVNFASHFFCPKTQEFLLNRGFPTASLPLIEQKLDDLDRHPGADRNYRALLHSIHAGLLRGHWVPAFPKSREAVEMIARDLRALIEAWDGDEGRIQKTLKGLNKKLEQLALDVSNQRREPVNVDRPVTSGGRA